MVVFVLVVEVYLDIVFDEVIECGCFDVVVVFWVLDFVGGWDGLVVLVVELFVLLIVED